MSPQVTIAAESSSTAEALALVQAYLDDIAARFPVDPSGGNVAPDPPEQYAPPVGEFLVVRVDGVPRGCGAVRVLSRGTAEVKRMWLHPAVRGQGIGRRLLDALEAAALRLGCDTVRLDTNASLAAALGLYASAGYREIERYNDNSDATHFFEKVLGVERS
jgi:GNAT superfamily N-acetyltransferase